MKINIKKMDDSKGKIVYLVECHCGEEIVFKRVPDWFKCPSCEKCISLFKIKENKKRKK